VLISQELASSISLFNDQRGGVVVVVDDVGILENEGGESNTAPVR
jgi:hypothetical protein